jgi:Ni,Fe-hydrogenase III small subunit
MRLPIFLLSVATLTAGMASAQTTLVTIINPVFTDDTLQCSPGPNCYSAGITGWICGPNTQTFKMSTTEYQNAPPEGLYVAALGDTAVTGSILQTLGATVQANKTMCSSLPLERARGLPIYRL